MLYTLQTVASTYIRAAGYWVYSEAAQRTMTPTWGAVVFLQAAGALMASTDGGPAVPWTAGRAQPACLPPHHNLSFCDTSLPAAQRAAHLVGLLTVEELVSQMVDSMAAIPRLGIGNYTYGIEALHGVAGDCPFPGVGGRCFTSFATSSASAASFNRSLWYSIGRAQVGLGYSTLGLHVDVDYM